MGQVLLGSLRAIKNLLFSANLPETNNFVQQIREATKEESSSTTSQQDGKVDYSDSKEDVQDDCISSENSI